MIRHAVSDTAVLTGRSLRQILRSPDTVITTAITPLIMMLLFVYVFGGAIDTGAGVGAPGYVTYLLPGLLLITVATGVTYTAVRMFQDRKSGILERFRSMPLHRSAVLWAHVLTSLVANLVSVLLVLAVALLIGFRSQADLLQWFVVGGLLAVFTLALTWTAVLAGVTGTSVEGASAFAYPLIFLPFLSSAFVPTATMPAGLRWFAEHQPTTALIDALRALLAGRSAGSDLWIALAWCLGALLVAQVLAVAVYRRRAARGIL